MNSHPRTVLVTGCSTGIGRATALHLADKGYRVFAGVRSQEHVAELVAVKNPRLQPILLQVTCESDVEKVREAIESSCTEGLFGLVNNAGVGLPSAVELSSANDLRNLLEVNTIAPLRLVQTFLPALRRAKGRVVNITSLNGHLSLPMVGAYSASKFALEALSDALRVELRPWGISVSTVRPGQVKTEIFNKARDALSVRREQIPDNLEAGYAKLYERAAKFNERGANSWTQPESVARVVHQALTARWPRPHYQVGLDSRGMRVLQKAVPQRLLDRLIARAMGLMKAVD